MAVILGFIVLVATFTIVATLVMLVLEKRKEIGVQVDGRRGAERDEDLHVAEGVTIGAVGTAFGLLLGYGTCLLVDKVGIPLDPEVYYISNLPVVIDPRSSRSSRSRRSGCRTSRRSTPRRRPPG